MMRTPTTSRIAYEAVTAEARSLADISAKQRTKEAV